MKPISIQDVRQAIGGKWLSAIPAEVPALEAVCTDTRRMDKSSLFIALKGDRFNGHDYLPAAAAGGAIAALVQDAPPTTLPNVHLIQVADTRQALGKLAAHCRKQLRSRVIAVGGSNGKTSTKHLIDAALNLKWRGSVSPKSFNNDIGVPLTIFAADPTQDYLVLELGTNHPGEMAVLTAMAQPDIAVITSISAEHLEGLGDLMGVRREEASIIDGLNPKGLLIINGDDPQLRETVARYPGKCITFGFEPHNDLFATDIQCTRDGVRFRLNNSRVEYFVPMLGRHTATNALAAIAVARRMGVEEKQILEGLAQASGPEMRLQMQQADGVSVLNDAYNANPASMEAALATLMELECSSRRIAVLGDMRELGEASQRLHRELGRFASQCKPHRLICVGPQSRLVAQSAVEAGLADVEHFESAAQAAQALPAQLRQGDLVLVKGSRGMRLEQVAQAIGAAPALEPLRKVAG